MKIILPSVFLLAATFSMGQSADKFAMFNDQKKSIVLGTGIVMKYIDAGQPDGISVILMHGVTDIRTS